MEIKQHKKVSGKWLDEYFASYVGMEGGNLEAAVWICDRNPQPWTESLVAPLSPREQPGAWDEDFRRRNRDRMSRWQSHQKIARVMSAARATTQRRPEGESEWLRYFEEHLYAPNGAEFKLSLFPLPLQLPGGMAWSRAFREQPALLPKQRYIDLCRTGKRFRFIAEIRARWRPKVVLCLGTLHLHYYIEAFGLKGLPSRAHVLQPADLAKTLHVIEYDGTVWVVCPALAGATGLSSDVLLSAMGGYIAQWLVSADFPAAAP